MLEAKQYHYHATLSVSPEKHKATHVLAAAGVLQTAFANATNAWNNWRELTTTTAYRSDKEKTLVPVLEKVTPAQNGLTLLLWVYLYVCVLCY